VSELAQIATLTSARGRLRGALGRYGLWMAAAALFIALPYIFKSGLALTTMSLMGIAIIFALSYNMLLGQTGMLSFGHAVYYGLGGFLAVHAMNTVLRNGLPIPLPLIPLVGGFAGLLFGVIFGSVSTRRAGTAFAMISLGLGELVASSALILRNFFGGEEGITTNRTKLFQIFDFSFGPQYQVYYLIAAWCLICMIAMYALTRTPFGRMCNAVRENPERVHFVGYNPQVVRFIAFCLAGFFAGIAGGLAAINFEIVNSAYVGAGQSGIVLLAAYIGGVGFFIGPILGAILVTYLQVMLSDVTEVWQLYFGLLFVGMVMFAPFGIAGLLMMHAPLWRAGTLARVVPAYALALAAGLVLLTGVILLIEMTVHLTVKASDGPMMSFLRMKFSVHSVLPWIIVVLLIGVGGWLCRRAWPVAAAAFHEAMARARERRLPA
jgi:branched-chain amino acid transport system permease protein